MRDPITIRGFKDIQKIGEGGSSIIYRGVWSLSGEPVAIKLARPEYRNLVDTEAKTQYMLSNPENPHPNIVKVITYGETSEEVPYFAMELMEGSLRDFTGKPPAELKAVFVCLEQVLAGLEHAHSKEVVHGDLKPANVLVNGGEVKLSDFGFGRQYDRETFKSTMSSSELRGTVEYVAPEILEGRPSSFVSDIYSLGVLMHELFTGRKPAYGTRIREINHDIPEEIDSVVTACLKRDPAERIPRIGIIMEQLYGKSFKTIKTQNSPGYFSRTWAWLMEDIGSKGKGEAQVVMAPEEIEKRAAAHMAALEATRHAIKKKKEEVKTAEAAIVRKHAEIAELNSGITRLKEEIKTLKMKYKTQLREGGVKWTDPDESGRLKKVFGWLWWEV